MSFCTKSQGQSHCQNQLALWFTYHLSSTANMYSTYVLFFHRKIYRPTNHTYNQCPKHTSTQQSGGKLKMTFRDIRYKYLLGSFCCKEFSWVGGGFFLVLFMFFFFFSLFSWNSDLCYPLGQFPLEKEIYNFNAALTWLKKR